jgi:hypothetical protein
LDDGGAQRAVASLAAAGQSTINDEMICDWNGVSWGDGGTTPVRKRKIHLEFKFNYYIFAFELNITHDSKE